MADKSRERVQLGCNCTKYPIGTAYKDVIEKAKSEIAQLPLHRDHTVFVVEKSRLDTIHDVILARHSSVGYILYNEITNADWLSLTVNSGT